MENMEKILNKIKNCLDLANNNPNENEAIAAALKAQELMAKYNIELDQVEDAGKEEREISEEMFECSRSDKWKVKLANIIAKNFRCKVYFMNRLNVVFYGYKEDAKIALQVFKYLYTVGNKFANTCYYNYKKEGKETKGVKNTYLVGFCDGVASVLEKQCTALMIVTPQEVKDAFNEKTKNFRSFTSNIKTQGTQNSAYSKGRADGRDVANARTLEKAC